MTCKFITVNEQKHGLLANPVIRAAIDLAIERTELLQLLSGDVIEGVNSFWLNQNDHSQDADPIDWSVIKHELASSGYQGESLVLATIPQYAADAEIIQQVCAKSGIPLQINLIPAEQFKGTARMSADLLLFAVMLDEHRELRLIDLYKSMQQHALPEVHDMLERSIQLILGEPDPSRREAIFMDIEAQLKERHSLFFLYRKHLKTAFHPSVRGIALESLGWVRFRDIWFT
jgi:SgrR family transcriptional regulator